jgi:hypothetical protein
MSGQSSLWNWDSGGDPFLVAGSLDVVNCSTVVGIDLPLKGAAKLAMLLINDEGGNRRKLGCLDNAFVSIDLDHMLRVAVVDVLLLPDVEIGARNRVNAIISLHPNSNVIDRLLTDAHQYRNILEDLTRIGISVRTVCSVAVLGRKLTDSMLIIRHLILAKVSIKAFLW